VFHRSSFVQTSFRPESWRFDGELPAPAPEAGIGGLAGGRRNKAWPKRKKRKPELEIQAALLTFALRPRSGL
jgi:hypothetical protein